MSKTKRWPGHALSDGQRRTLPHFFPSGAILDMLPSTYLDSLTLCETGFFCFCSEATASSLFKILVSSLSWVFTLRLVSFENKTIRH